MKGRLLVVLFFSIPLAGVASFVGENNIFSSVEKKAGSVEISDLNETEYIVDNDDSEEVCYFKLVASLNYIFHSKTSRAINFAIANANKAEDFFPDIVEIKVICVYIKSIRSPEGKLLFASRCLFPYVQEVEDNPGIAATLSREYRKIKFNIEHKSKGYIKRHRQDAYRLFDCNNDDQLVRNLELLSLYWSLFEKPELEKDVIRVVEARKKMTREMRKEARSLWKNILKGINTPDLESLRHEIIKQVYVDISKKESASSLARKQEYEEYKAQQYKEVLLLFNELEVAPNPMDKISKIFSKAAKCKGQLRDCVGIPNYFRLKEVYVGSNEADILNLAFLVYFQNNKSDTLDEIKKIKGADNDLRILSLKVYCLRSLDRSGEEISPLVDKILSIDPKNVEAKMYRIYLDSMRENGGKGASSKGSSKGSVRKRRLKPAESRE